MLVKALVKTLPELFVLSGCAAITYGVYQIHVPAAWIAGGAMAAAAGIMAAILIGRG